MGRVCLVVLKSNDDAPESHKGGPRPPDGSPHDPETSSCSPCTFLLLHLFSLNLPVTPPSLPPSCSAF
ncbi:hypothetical protein Hamer_G019838 [Homarus americanus]|uniref:Uncharacterized protein n=1 Tax=Homarus americanus TaxID=6706 RepID=A0A8J5JU85_HOMAM|nr:hypothetical protein Hamer_G019838 [Homarus americanus]